MYVYADRWEIDDAITKEEIEIIERNPVRRLHLH